MLTEFKEHFYKPLICERGFICPKKKTLCKLAKCEEFENCKFKVKYNYQKWKDAFVKGNKALLKGIINGGK